MQQTKSQNVTTEYETKMVQKGAKINTQYTTLKHSNRTKTRNEGQCPT